MIDHRLLAGKLTVYNWMKDTPEGCTPSEIVEVRFKNTRKGFYLNNSNLKLDIGDIVAVEAALGHDIGIVSLTGELVREQMRLKKVDLERNPLKKIYRKAKPHDIEKWQQAIALEHDTMIRSRVIAADLGLDMKIGDVDPRKDESLVHLISDKSHKIGRGCAEAVRTLVGRQYGIVALAAGLSSLWRSRWTGVPCMK